MVHLIIGQGITQRRTGAVRSASTFLERRQMTITRRHFRNFSRACGWGSITQSVVLTLESKTFPTHFRGRWEGTVGAAETVQITTCCTGGEFTVSTAWVVRYFTHVTLFTCLHNTVPAPRWKKYWLIQGVNHRKKSRTLFEDIHKFHNFQINPINPTNPKWIP